MVCTDLGASIGIDGLLQGIQESTDGQRSRHIVGATNVVGSFRF